MGKIAKIFMNGRSQAVRLPASFRFNETDEVNIRKNPITGEVILSPKPKDWSAFVCAAGATQIPDDFISNRTDEPAQSREIL